MSKIKNSSLVRHGPPFANNYCIIILNASECGFAFTPSEGSLGLTTALVFAHQNETITITFKQFKMVDASLTDAAISVINGTHQFVNGSLCQIASLEVYRGSNQITEISYAGFSLSENGIVEVAKSICCNDVSIA